MPADGGGVVDFGGGGADTDDVGIGIDELPVPGAVCVGGVGGGTADDVGGVDDADDVVDAEELCIDDVPAVVRS